MSDLISRKALLEEMRKENVLKVYECIQLVNNAPAIERGEAVGFIDEFGSLESSQKQWMIDEPNIEWQPLYLAPPQLQTVKDALEKAAVITWSSLMDYCKKKNKNPAHDNDLFEVVNKLRELIEKE